MLHTYGRNRSFEPVNVFKNIATDGISMNGCDGFHIAPLVQLIENVIQLFWIDPSQEPKGISMVSGEPLLENSALNLVAEQLALCRRMIVAKSIPGKQEGVVGCDG